jgi:hypothetical protein
MVQAQAWANASIPAIVDHKAVLLSIQEIVPTIEDINACLTVDDLSALPTDNAASVINFKALRSFFLAPFLRNAILAADSLSPLALVLTGRAVREELINTHNEDEDFDEEDVKWNYSPSGVWGSTKERSLRKNSPLPQTTANSATGAPASTVPTSCQALKQQPPFLPP